MDESGPVSVPGVTGITASEVTAPPGWALMERQLISLMEEAAVLMIEKYTERGGALYYKDALDDLYERIYNWGLFYAMGAEDRILDLALQEWNAITRTNDEEIVHRKKVYEYSHDSVILRFPQQGYREYYNYAVPGGAEWHHKGEANPAFYYLGLADPTISENVRRARTFAGFYIGEDPEAPNWDPVHKILRSPIQTGRGPCLSTDLIDVQRWLHGSEKGSGRPLKPMGTRATLYPVIKELELDWMDNPARAEEIVDLFNKIVLNSDSSNNLASTGLVTNAYLYTGEEKYKKWVLEYVEVWMDRIRENGGIIPDNVGPTGKIGENREGQWWGGMYGWNHYQGFNIMFHGLTIAAESALMLSRDYGYLDLLRSQINVLLDNAITREDGQLLVPTRYGKNGWHEPAPTPFQFTGPQPMRIEELAHLYHASMSPEDYALIDRVRDGDVVRDWNHVPVETEKNAGDSELPRLQYYEGKNPDWPVKALGVEYEMSLSAYENIKNESDDFESIIKENTQPENPVFTKGLTQVTMGSPQAVYNGGLLRATVRYFDQDRLRSGLPRDVAALVDKLAPDGVGIQLVNLSRHETRNLIVQAGAFGEHTFTEVRHGGKVVPVDAKYFAVRLPPSTSIRVEAGMRRFANDPSYAFPWHGDKVPVPFQ